MATINAITLVGCSNSAHFIYMKRILERAQKDTNVTATCAAQVQNLKAAYADEDEALKISQKSTFTDEITAADGDRDRLYSAYKKMVENMLGFSEPDMAQAAKALAQNLKNYGISTSMQLERETGLIYNMLQDLEGKLAPHVETLGLGAVIKKLKDANDRVEELTVKRTDAGKAKITGQMKKCRLASDAAYKKLVAVVNALALLQEENPQQLTNPTATLDDFINYVNAEVARFKREVLGQTTGAATPAEGSGETPGDTPGGDDGKEEEGGGTSPTPDPTTPDPTPGTGGTGGNDDNDFV